MKSTSIVLRLLGMPLLCVLAMAGCAREQPAGEAATAEPILAGSLPSGFTAAASMLDVMHDPIDTNASVLWEASAELVPTDDGKPAVVADERWDALRLKALLLMEGANLLVTEGRPLVRPGQVLRSPAGEDGSSYTPAQAQAEIDKDRAAFVAFSQVMQNAAGQIVAAIDKRDAEAYDTAGGTLSDACAACHQRFWYPPAAGAAP
jgi:hypothetical protein